MASMQKTTPISLILYWNADHSEVHRAKYNAMVSPGGQMDDLTDVIISHKLPVVYSTQGIDPQLLAQKNPRLLQKIVGADAFISGTAGMWSHALPSFTVNTLDAQLAYARTAFEQTKMPTSTIGMLPEFDASAGLIPSFLMDGKFSSILLQRGVNTLYDYISRDAYASTALADTAPAFTYIENEAGTRISAISTEGPHFRKAWLGMLRGVVTKEEVLKTLQADAALFAAKAYPFMPVLIDAEAFVINQSDKNPAPAHLYSMLEHLARARDNNDIELIGFDTRTQASVDSYLAAHGNFVSKLNQRPKQKWKLQKDTDGLTDFVQSTQLSALSTYHQRALLVASGSDYFSARAKTDVKLPAKLADGTVVDGAVHILSEQARIDEFLHLRASVENNRRVTEQMDGLSAASQEHMHVLDAIFSQK